MELAWIKCVGDSWCQLNRVNLVHSHFDDMEGVYVIWHAGTDAHTVRVGQGNIRERLTAHRTDVEVQAYANHGLYVTWASVTPGNRDGIEAYLAVKLTPRKGVRSPKAAPIPVNLPW